MGKNKKPKKPTKGQHYVPQLYLRGFTNATGKMFCYDKAADRVYPISPEDAAKEANFYELPSPPGKPIPVNFVENALQKRESDWAPLLGKLIESADAGTITLEQLLEFSRFVAVQWMRTKSYREEAHELISKAGQAMVDDFVRLNSPEMEGKLKFNLEIETIAGAQAQQFLDPKLVIQITEGLNRHIWVVGINETAHLFYTSDHPVARRANLKIGDRLGVGILDRGIEFVFPLDSKHILLIMERTHFADWKKHDNKSIKLTAEQVRDYNGLQVKRSSQRIFCANDDFDLARQLCQDNQLLRDPNRPRIKVETSPIVDMKNYILATALE